MASECAFRAAVRSVRVRGVRAPTCNTMRSSLRVLLFALSILVLAIAFPIPAQSGTAGAARPGGLPARSTPPLSLSFTSPYTYYFPFLAKTQSLTISNVTLSQGTSLENVGFTIQSRTTVMRAFVSVPDGSTITGVNARLYVMNGSTTVSTVDSNTITAPSSGACPW